MAYDLDKPQIRWGEDHSYSLRTAYSGTVCFGATGSGKTSGVGALLRSTFLSSGSGKPVPEGMGGVILTAKASDQAEWVDAIKKAGRLDDLFIFGGPEGRRDARFDFCEWQATRGGEGSGQILNTQLLLSEIAIAAERARGNTGAGQGGGDSAYFQTQLATLLTWLLLLVVTARIPPTIGTMSALMDSAPENIAALKSKDWQAGGMGQVLAMLAQDCGPGCDSERRADIENLFAFFTAKWPSLNQRPRSIVEGMFSAMCSPFLQQPLRALFTGGKSTITPEACFDGTLVLVDIPVLQNQAVGAVCAQCWKYCFQQAVMQRSGKTEALRPAFLWADEFQNFVTARDAEYQAVARGLASPTVYLTQQIQSLSRVLGEDTTENLLANLQTKFFGQNAGATNEWASNLIGSRYVWEDTLNMGGGASHDIGGLPQGHSGHTGITRSRQLRPYVLPAEFLTLRTGGPLNDREVDTIVFSGGRTFAGENGERVPYKRLTFRQER